MKNSGNLFRLAVLLGEYKSRLEVGDIKGHTKKFEEIQALLNLMPLGKLEKAKELVRVYGSDSTRNKVTMLINKHSNLSDTMVGLLKKNMADMNTVELSEALAKEAVDLPDEGDDTLEEDYVDADEVFAQEQAEAKKVRDAKIAEEVKVNKQPKVKLKGTVDQRKAARQPGTCLNCGSEIDGHKGRHTCCDACDLEWKEDQKKDKKNKKSQAKYRAKRKAKEEAKKK